MNRISELLLDTTPPPPPEYLIGPVEAAEFLHRDIQIVLIWAELGLIPAHRLRYDGHEAWRFRISELAEWRKQYLRENGPKGLRQLTADTRKVFRLSKNSAGRNPNTRKS